MNRIVHLWLHICGIPKTKSVCAWIFIYYQVSFYIHQQCARMPATPSKVDYQTLGIILEWKIESIKKISSSSL